MPLRKPPILLVLIAVALAGCGSQVPRRPPENTYVNKPEAVVRSELGEPHHEFAGHYGNPPLDFTKKFTGEIKTLVFKKSGGEYYVSFEKRPPGWVSICSSWLPDGAAF